jgi:D-sedoheptulose 7-phosphate isomerase
MLERIIEHFNESARLKLDMADLLPAAIERAADQMLQCILRDGKVLACGNGGSAADAQHFASLMVHRFEFDRPGLAAIALSTNTSTLTSVANDDAFAQVFARQVSALGHQGDVLLAISTSGHSTNIIAAADAARRRDMTVIALTGRDGGGLAEQLSEHDVLICVPADSTARIHEIHLLTLHCLCDAIDGALLGVET